MRNRLLLKNAVPPAKAEAAPGQKKKPAVA
jgi:hypothetical protein